MPAEKFIHIIKGLIKAVIPLKKLHIPAQTGGTTESGYCYTTWLRHLILLNKNRPGIPVSVAELGPGDSLGTGIAALLCGCEQYIALDHFRYGSPERNVQIFDELVELFSNRAPLPGDTAFPLLVPSLDNYDFPAHILTADVLAGSLAPARLAAIRKELAAPAPSNIYVQSFIPWQVTDIKAATLDLVFSQAALQYTDLNLVYSSCSKWLKPGGIMSHTIDLASLGSHSAWNGHWAYSALEWKLFSIGKKMLINREPLSYHKKHLAKYHFNLMDIIPYKKTGGLPKEQLAKEFSRLHNEDVETHAAYMLAVKA